MQHALSSTNARGLLESGIAPSGLFGGASEPYGWTHEVEDDEATTDLEPVGRRPMRRLVVLVVIIVLAVLFVRPYGQVGTTSTKGGFTIPRICYGVELWGTPGVFRTC